MTQFINRSLMYTWFFNVFFDLAGSYLSWDACTFQSNKKWKLRKHSFFCNSNTILSLLDGKYLADNYKFHVSYIFNSKYSNYDYHFGYTPIIKYIMGL